MDTSSQIDFNMAKKKQEPTFAQRAKDIMKRYGYNEKTKKFLRPDDVISQDSMTKELEQLRMEQELMKSEKEAAVLARGGQLPDIPMMFDGGEFDITASSTYSPYIQGYPSGYPSSANDALNPNSRYWGFNNEMEHPDSSQPYSPGESLMDLALGYADHAGFDGTVDENNQFQSNKLKGITPHPNTYSSLNYKNSKPTPLINEPVPTELRYLSGDDEFGMGVEFTRNDAPIFPKSTNPNVMMPAIVSNQSNTIPDPELEVVPYNNIAKDAENVGRIGTTGKFFDTIGKSDFGQGIKQGVKDNPYLAASAATQLLGTGIKAAYLAGRDEYNPLEYKPTQIPEFEKVDYSEAQKAARAQIAGTKGSIKRNARTRGELLGNLSAATANEGAAVAQIEERENAANAQARNAYNMQVAQVKLQDAQRKLQTGVINQQMYDAITANWMSVLDESVMGLSGTAKDFNAANVQKQMIPFLGGPNQGTIKIGNTMHPTFTTDEGMFYYDVNTNEVKPVPKKSK